MQPTYNIMYPLIDLLSAESFGTEHIPGAVNICVYEVAFIDKIRAAFPDSVSALTIYGLNDATLEASVALKKLEAAGYRNVRVLSGGLQGWKANGGEIQQGSDSGRESVSGSYEIDQDTSLGEWMGRNLFNRHRGTVQLGPGTVLIRDGLLAGGHLTVDMSTLRCTDLTDPALNALLIAHLKSEDFFWTEKFPNAKFDILAATPQTGIRSDKPNYEIKGDFTLRGMTKSIDFPAVVTRKPGSAFTAQALLEIDRTWWGSVYGSAKFFGGLGQHLVNDVIHLYLKVVTKEHPVSGAEGYER